MNDTNIIILTDGELDILNEAMASYMHTNEHDKLHAKINFGLDDAKTFSFECNPSLDSEYDYKWMSSDNGLCVVDSTGGYGEEFNHIENGRKYRATVVLEDVGVNDLLRPRVT